MRVSFAGFIFPFPPPLLPFGKTLKYFEHCKLYFGVLGLLTLLQPLSQYQSPTCLSFIRATMAHDVTFDFLSDSSGAGEFEDGVEDSSFIPYEDLTDPDLRAPV